jgi:hypothetical protein
MLLAASPAYAPTPQAAARRIVYSNNGSKIVIVRTNIVGPYATVLVHGGYMEGSRVDDAALLFKHFSFGWQGLESLNFRCLLDGQVTSPETRAQLMRGMPAPSEEHACGNRELVDVGAPAQIETLRREQFAPFVSSVVISGKYAMVQWYGAGGGQQLLQKQAGRWQRLIGGGGALGVTEMRKYGIPHAAWCAFGIFDAKCGLERTSARATPKA